MLKWQPYKSLKGGNSTKCTGLLEGFMGHLILFKAGNKIGFFSVGDFIHIYKIW